MVMILSWKRPNGLKKILKDPSKIRLKEKIERLESRGWRRTGEIHEYRFEYHIVLTYLNRS
jgi:hypothetical protein